MKKLFIIPIMMIALMSLSMGIISYPTDNAYLFTADDFYVYNNLLDETASLFLPETNESGNLTLSYQLPHGLITSADLLLNIYFSGSTTKNMSVYLWNSDTSQNDLLDTFEWLDSGNLAEYVIGDEYISYDNVIYVTFEEMFRNDTLGIGVAISNVNYTYIPACDEFLTNTTCAVYETGLTLAPNVSVSNANITILTNLALTLGENNNITGHIYATQNNGFFISNVNATTNITIHPVDTFQAWIRPYGVITDQDININLLYGAYNFLWKKNNYQSISDNNDRVWFQSNYLNGTINNEVIQFGEYYINVDTENNLAVSEPVQIVFDGITDPSNYTIIKKDGITATEGTDYNITSVGADSITLNLATLSNWSIETPPTTTPECDADLTDDVCQITTADLTLNNGTYSGKTITMNNSYDLYLGNATLTATFNIESANRIYIDNGVLNANTNITGNDGRIYGETSMGNINVTMNNDPYTFTIFDYEDMGGAFLSGVIIFQQSNLQGTFDSNSYTFSHNGENGSVTWNYDDITRRYRWSNLSGNGATDYFFYEGTTSNPIRELVAGVDYNHRTATAFGGSQNGTIEIELIAGQGITNMFYSDQEYLNNPPTILTRSPLYSSNMATGEVRLFNITVYEPDNDTLTYNWTINGEEQTNTSNIYYNSTGFIGQTTIIVTVSDVDGNDTTSWSIMVSEEDTSYRPTYEAEDLDDIAVDGTARILYFIYTLVAIIGIVSLFLFMRKRFKEFDL